MREDGLHISAGASWRGENCNIKEQFDEADRRMYEDKKRFYSDGRHDAARPLKRLWDGMGTRPARRHRLKEICPGERSWPAMSNCMRCPLGRRLYCVGCPYCPARACHIPAPPLWRESRANGADRGHRACRADRPDRAARSHGRNRACRRNRPYRRTGRCRTARAARGYRPDRACRWAARPGGSGRPDRSHRPCRSYRADRSHRPDRSDGYDRTHGTCWNTGRPGGARADRTVRESGRDGSDRTDRGHRACGCNWRDGSCRTDGNRRRSWSDRRDGPDRADGGFGPNWSDRRDGPDRADGGRRRSWSDWRDRSCRCRPAGCLCLLHRLRGPLYKRRSDHAFPFGA